ncbi:TetR/AcrR family transcriptional regulator [Nocardia asteroides NBRC 15531]|uniref:TetR family transcriptional regulator n=1 Tax=Nocardia asteroides NBRC 15531 TaxID=1110697 RepID=U5EMM3_NOCAS|nr:TetR/AcrR family transcriptional regulator [Nocardia asteroides]TLF67128.1 TetR/AcrR family transcriptional regulator [Nocardia asteroides NBRC 15531]TLF67346.1 TetR/AcrR family transcriptional regulator [Nocardia asteroides NBRC 15531]UGT51597.1 TetR/AcrR family transcriptional regulator [Nocardia asteroides]SFM22056.1 transcriptional regulator, TetR family [Nocardia asteroides]VEG35505.1 Bacterial regulatory proteins, tetR family [Nocardia asteroides]
MSEAPPAGRPRDVRIDEAVLAAARELVAEVGYADLTFRAIAERAGTSVPAIRRRWASKAHLVHEAVYPADAVAAPTGAADLRAEVRAVVERCLAIVGSPAGRRATPALMSELMADHALEEELSSRLLSAGWDTLAARLAEAAARGEARPDVDLGLFIEMVFGTTLVAIVLRGRAAVDDAWVDEVVRSIVDGLAAR